MSDTGIVVNWLGDKIERLTPDNTGSLWAPAYKISLFCLTNLEGELATAVSDRPDQTAFGHCRIGWNEIFIDRDTLLTQIIY